VCQRCVGVHRLSALFDEMVSTFRMFGGDDDVTDPLS